MPRRSHWVVAVGIASLASLTVMVGSAAASFPGRDGLLAVQPLKGYGIILVDAHGTNVRRWCVLSECATLGREMRPSWSPDGRSLMVSARYGFELIYTDGSCLNCYGGMGSGLDAAFTANPTLITAISAGQLVEYGVDGLVTQVLLDGDVSDPVWSSRGELAVVRGRWIWSGQPTSLTRFARGAAPSWSPDGREVVFQRGGWIVVSSVASRSFRRLVRGSAPAWSPDGASIAFFDSAHRLGVVRVADGRVRYIGDVKGVAVDWQPLPSKRTGCVSPPGSTVLASSSSGLVTADSGISNWPEPAAAYMGCVWTAGRARLLVQYGQGVYDHQYASDAAVAGSYAALVLNQDDLHYGATSSDVEVFNLATGQVVNRLGGEQTSCPAGGCGTSMDSLVVNDLGFTAAHVETSECAGGAPQPVRCTSYEQIDASDSSGVQVVDSASENSAFYPQLTNLTLTGDTLTWEHSGKLESAQLR